MRKKTILAGVLGASTLTITALAPSWALTLKTDKEKSSYAIGREIGENFKKQGWDIDADILAESFKSAFSGKPSEMSPEEMKGILQNVQKNMRAKFQEKMAGLSKANIEEGKKFLEENKKKKGVTETKSGLQYRVLRAGTGKTPAATDTVETNYRGTFIDGTEFDSSYKRKQTATFPVSGVIKGWTEALLMMKEGAKWEVFVPPELGYGSRGSSPAIGPNKTLVFTVELIAVK
ncbi:MAG: FKBP-type peptidyl-prolyl cis-trans isomerase [Nitrospinota bacterium]